MADDVTHVRASREDVHSERHQGGIPRLDRIHRAVVETDGKIRFIPYVAANPK